ncbi:MAG TPA: helix-turn-helix transcriptional regulator [Gemmatimonadales bacterium]|jgi:transcriptional regulator with XRE-family HTH domain|nr:helix-turn-helix transcriptional regulator [Gemmatimonadales bacterium]
MTNDIAAQLGAQLRQLRLLQNIDQRALAARAGVAWNVIKRLEAGTGSTVESLIKVLRALGREDWLNTLAPAVSISPLQLAAARTKTPRQRASRRGRRGV